MLRKTNSNGNRGRGESARPLIECPLCHASYNRSSSRVVYEQAGRHLLHIQCGECGNAVLALFMTSPEGISSLGMVTDLTASDADRFKDAEGVSIDDVISLHELLCEKKIFIKKLL